MGREFSVVSPRKLQCRGVEVGTPAKKLFVIDSSRKKENQFFFPNGVTLGVVTVLQADPNTWV